MSIYQVVVSPSRVTEAVGHILTTWQATDTLLLLGSSVVLAERIVKNYPKFTGKIGVLEKDRLAYSLVENAIINMSLLAWVELSQQHTVITLDFS